VVVSDAGAAVARFDFTNGPMRATYLTLYSACLVHRGDSHLETLPLATVASVRVSFERDSRRLGWGIALLLLALLMFAISSPLAGLAGRGASELASGSNNVAAALGTLFRIVEAVAHVLPGIAAAAALGGVALAALGWYGTTIFTLTFAGGERVYPSRGRTTMLLDFAESVSEKLMQLQR
jgi:hypothetical protein